MSRTTWRRTHEARNPPSQLPTTIVPVRRRSWMMQSRSHIPEKLTMPEHLQHRRPGQRAAGIRVNELGAALLAVIASLYGSQRPALAAYGRVVAVSGTTAEVAGAFRGARVGDQVVFYTTLNPEVGRIPTI